MKFAIFSAVVCLVANAAMAQHGRHEHEHGAKRYIEVESWEDLDVSPGGRRHVERLADGLWNAVNAVCWEAYRKYKHQPNYRDAYGEMRQMLDDVTHIQELVRDQRYHESQHTNDHIARDLHDINQTFHHLEDDIQRWRVRPGHHAARHNDYYRNYGSLRARMARLEETLHHLMEDYGVDSRFAADAEEAPPAAP